MKKMHASSIGLALLAAVVGCRPSGPGSPAAAPERGASSPAGIRLPRAGFPCSFDREPFVTPAFLKDFATWQSDQGDQVVAVNLTDAQKSNRYHGDVQVHESKGRNPAVSWRDDEAGTTYGYRLVGVTDSGIHVLRTWDFSDTGSGVFSDVMLVSLEIDRRLEYSPSADRIQPGTERLLLRKRGVFPLGDRWEGALSVDGNRLLVGPDAGRFAAREDDAEAEDEDSPEMDEEALKVFQAWKALRASLPDDEDADTAAAVESGDLPSGRFVEIVLDAR
jgi:hypothetical protein